MRVMKVEIARDREDEIEKKKRKIGEGKLDEETKRDTIINREE